MIRKEKREAWLFCKWNIEWCVSQQEGIGQRPTCRSLIMDLFWFYKD